MTRSLARAQGWPAPLGGGSGGSTEAGRGLWDLKEPDLPLTCERRGELRMHWEPGEGRLAPGGLRGWGGAARDEKSAPLPLCAFSPGCTRRTDCLLPLLHGVRKAARSQHAGSREVGGRASHVCRKSADLRPETALRCLGPRREPAGLAPGRRAGGAPPRRRHATGVTRRPNPAGPRARRLGAAPGLGLCGRISDTHD